MELQAGDSVRWVGLSDGTVFLRRVPTPGERDQGGHAERRGAAARTEEGDA